MSRDHDSLQARCLSHNHSIQLNYISVPLHSTYTQQLTGQHWPCHQGRNPEKPGGPLPGDLWPGPKEDLCPDGEGLLRALPAVRAIPGDPGQLKPIHLGGRSIKFTIKLGFGFKGKSWLKPWLTLRCYTVILVGWIMHGLWTSPPSPTLESFWNGLHLYGYHFVLLQGKTQGGKFHHNLAFGKMNL